MLKLAGLGGVGAAALAAPLGRDVAGSSISLLSSSRMPRPYAVPFRAQEELQPYRTGSDGTRYYDVWAREGKVEIAPGLLTPVLGYTGKKTGPGEVPGPLISVEMGTPVVLTMHNQLPVTHPTFKTPVKISTHLHGAASLPQYDGYANDVTLKGFKKHYCYSNHQPARTLWYHDHGFHYTAQNAYSGLAAQYHVHDPAERELLPQGEFDVALTLTDLALQANGSQLYDDRSQSGLWGDVILVNGRPWPVMKVKPRIYRFRILNAAVSRSFRPVMSAGVPTYMVATDGGLMPKSQRVSSWRHANSERYEVLVDFRAFAGRTVYLNNLSNDNNRDFDHTGKIMRFDVAQEGALGPDTARALTSIPDTLVPSPVMNLSTSSAKTVRRIRVDRTNGLWALNGQTWGDVMASGYRSRLANPNFGDVEIWEFQNNSGGWFHPMHIHLVDFKLLSRNGSAAGVKNYELGPKDTVYVGEGETVRMIMKFGDEKSRVSTIGRYMVHCHNLVHEDHDMMHQFTVGLNDRPDPNDPITSAPPVPEADTTPI